MADIELGVGIINLQAAGIKELVYPDWTIDKSWKVTAKVGTDEHGYDLYQLDRYGDSITVPANRLVVMAKMLESMTS